MNLHEDCLHIIASYIDPNPYIYYRLASVSRSFYATFMSDQHWQAINPRQWRQNIARRFYYDSEDDLGAVKYYWTAVSLQSVDQRTQHFLPPFTCQYAAMGFSIYTLQFHTTIKSPSPTTQLPTQHVAKWVFSYGWTSVKFGSHFMKFATTLDTPNALKFVSKYPESYEYFPSTLRNDKNICLAALEHCSSENGRTYELIISKYSGDSEILLAVAGIRGVSLEYAPTALRNDRALMLQAIQKRGACYKYASQELRSEVLFAIEAVTRSAGVYEMLPPEQRDDDRVIKAAALLDGKVLEHADDSAKNDKSFVLTCVSSCPSAIEFASSKLITDHEVIIAAAKHDCKALEKVPQETLGDKELILTLLEYQLGALAYSSLRQENSFVKRALLVSWQAFRYAGEEPKADINVVQVAAQHNIANLQYADKTIRNDWQYLLDWYEIDPRAAQYFSPSLLERKPLVLKLCSKSLEVLKHARVLTQDADFMLDAIDLLPGAFPYIAAKLEEDVNFIISVLKKHPFLYAQVKKTHKVVLAVVKVFPWALESTPQWNNDPSIVEESVSRYPMSLEFASADLKDDPKIVRRALRECLGAAQFASQRLQEEMASAWVNL